MAHHSEEDDIEFEANFSNKEEAEIRTRLIALQEKIREANVPVIVLLCGVNGSGKNAALGTLRDWLDQRQLDLHAYERRDIQKDPIEFRRYWCDTPINGNTGIFVSPCLTTGVRRRISSSFRNVCVVRTDRVHTSISFSTSTGSLTASCFIFILYSIKRTGQKTV